MSHETVYEHYDMLGVIKAHVVKVVQQGEAVYRVREAGYGETRTFIRLGSAKLYLENKYI